jgi:LmbE family N-acetylglucosaminyl deacetylase
LARASKPRAKSKPPVLIVAAHPDDEALGCGGSMARLADEGAAVHVHFLADGVGARSGGPGGRAGGPDAKALKARRGAALKACDILGAASVTFGDFSDNRLDTVALLDIIRQVEARMEVVRPALVLTHHAGDLNIDHRRVHDAVVTACRPHPTQSVRTLLFFELPSSTEWQVPGTGQPFEPTWFVDISKTLARKIAALKAYRMELRPWPHARSLEAITHLARWRGSCVGVEAAEAFVLGRTIL